MCVLGHNGEGKLELEGRCELDLAKNDKVNDEDASETNGGKLEKGYKFFKKLRIVPTKYLRPRQIRISYG